MIRKWLLSAFSLFFLYLFAGCPIYHSSYDMEHIHYQNNSSYNILFQYHIASRPGDWFHFKNYDYEELKGNICHLIIDTIPAGEEYGNDYFNFYSPLDKVLIIDADTRGLIRRIDGDSFLKMLTVEKNVEKSKHETITHYIYHLNITDELLNK